MLADIELHYLDRHSHIAHVFYRVRTTWLTLIQSVNNAKIVKTTVTTERKQQKQDKDYFSNL